MKILLLLVCIGMGYGLYTQQQTIGELREQLETSQKALAAAKTAIQAPTQGGGQRSSPRDNSWIYHSGENSLLNAPTRKSGK